MSLPATSMVSAVVLAAEKRLVAATMPVKKAVASSSVRDFSSRAIINLAAISLAELACSSLHSTSPNLPEGLVVMLTVVASCMMRPFSRRAASSSEGPATLKAITRSILKSP